MSEGDGRGQIAAFVLILFRVFAFGLGGWEAGVISSRRVEAERATRHIEENAEDYIDRVCIGSDRSDILKCVQGVMKSSREDQRSEYDLNAQESMARSTSWLLILSAITTVVAAIGAYYVRETLAETRAAVRVAENANEVSREMGQAQVRAYIAVNPGLPFDIDIDESPKVHVSIENTGQSSVYRVSCASGIVSRDWGVDGKENFISIKNFENSVFFFPDNMGCISAGGKENTIAKFAMIMNRDIYRKCFDGGDNALFLVVIVSYFDVFGSPHVTRLCARMDDPYRMGGFAGMPETGQCRWTPTLFHNDAT